MFWWKLTLYVESNSYYPTVSVLVFISLFSLSGFSCDFAGTSLSASFIFVWRQTPAQQETRRILAQSFRESERGSKSPRSKIDSFGGAIFTFMLRWYVDGFMS